MYKPLGDPLNLSVSHSQHLRSHSLARRAPFTVAATRTHTHSSHKTSSRPRGIVYACIAKSANESIASPASS